MKRCKYAHNVRLWHTRAASGSNLSNHKTIGFYRNSQWQSSEIDSFGTLNAQIERYVTKTSDATGCYVFEYLLLCIIDPVHEALLKRVIVDFHRKT